MSIRHRTSSGDLKIIERKKGVTAKPIYLIDIPIPEVGGAGMQRFLDALDHLKIIPIVRIGTQAPQWGFDPDTSRCITPTGIVYDTPEQGALDWFCLEAWPTCTTADKHLRRGLPNE